MAKQSSITQKKYLLTFACLICIFELYSAIAIIISKPHWWFENFHYFTIQSNICVLIVAIIYIIFFILKKEFKFNYFVYITLINICVVAILWNTILLQDDIWNKPKKEVYIWFSNISLHIICPIAYLLFYWYGIKEKNHNMKINLKLLYIVEFSYVILYLVYAIVLPFITEHSVYGIYTNLNAKNGGSIWCIFSFIGAFILFNIIFFIFAFIYKKKCTNKKN